MNTGTSTPAHKVARGACAQLRKLSLRRVRHDAARVLAEQLRNDAFVLTTSADLIEESQEERTASKARLLARAAAFEVVCNLRDRAKRLVDLADALVGR